MQRIERMECGASLSVLQFSGESSEIQSWSFQEQWTNLSLPQESLLPEWCA